MKALMFDKIGDPLQVLALREMLQPIPGKGEVLVRMLAASINPGDFLFIQNQYPEPKRPIFPGQIAGNHGIGRVTGAGAGDAGLEEGALVAFSYLNSWAEFAVVPKEWLILLPDDFPIALGAQMVNLITAWDLLESTQTSAGDWIAVTAGYSTVA
jgi:NADPH2:quinone reductase